MSPYGLSVRIDGKMRLSGSIGLVIAVGFPYATLFETLRAARLSMKLNPIVLVGDDMKDIELTVLALKGSYLSNEVIALRDGQEALDFLYRERAYQDRPGSGRDLPAHQAAEGELL